MFKGHIKNIHLSFHFSIPSTKLVGKKANICSFLLLFYPSSQPDPKNQ